MEVLIMRAYSAIAAGVVAMATLVALPACQTVTGKVPSTAMEVSAGTGNVSYRAAEDGRIYVYNRDTNNLVYSGEVRRGELLVLDTVGDRVLVDNRPVVERVNLDGGNRYQIYLDPHSRVVSRHAVNAPTTTVVERRPVVERREVVVPHTTYERKEVVVPRTTYERRAVDVPTGTTVERRTLVAPDGQTVIEREVRER
jgi:hypothetical protein